MPSFCRHNRLIQNCPICSREQALEMRPVVSSAAPKVSQPRPPRAASGGASGRMGGATATRSGPRSAGSRGDGRGSAAGLRVRRIARGAEDGYSSPLVPGLKSSADAARLADEIAFAATRLEVLALEPPGLYAEIAAPGDVEERTWLAFLIAYLSPLDGADPFDTIEAVRTTWASGTMPDLAEVTTGPRSAHDPGRGLATLQAYRSWAARAGSQSQAFTGEPAWGPVRRFDRVFERLALPGMHRCARYELLVSLGRLGLYDLSGGSLQLVGANRPTDAAKRALGIGDRLLLEKRAGELAAACGVPLESLDLALHNWEAGSRFHGGLSPEVGADPAVVERAHAALGL